MKTTVSFILLMFCMTLILQAKEHKKENNLIGYWKLVKAMTNGLPNPKSAMDRTFKYTEEGLFEGKLFINGEEHVFPKGKYYLPDDTTMICINLTLDNKVVGLSNTYYFHVKNDSLNIYGAWFSNIKEQPNLLYLNHINEWWVRIPDKNNR